MHPVPPPETETPEQLHERARLWCQKHYEETRTYVDPVSGKRLPGVCLSKDPNREDRRRLRKFRGDPRTWKPVVGFEPKPAEPGACILDCLTPLEHELMTGKRYVKAEHPAKGAAGMTIGGRPVVESTGFSLAAADQKDNDIYVVTQVGDRWYGLDYAELSDASKLRISLREPRHFSQAELAILHRAASFPAVAEPNWYTPEDVEATLREFEHGGQLRVLSAGEGNPSGFTADVIHASDVMDLGTPVAVTAALDSILRPMVTPASPDHPPVVESAWAVYASCVRYANTLEPTSPEYLEALQRETRAGEDYKRLHAEFPPHAPVPGCFWCSPGGVSDE